MSKKIFLVLLGVLLVAGSGLAQEAYNLQLRAGDNLIALPLLPQDTDIAVVLSPIITQVNDVWEFEPLDADDPWKHYQPGMEEYSDLQQMTGGRAYWINLKRSLTLQITGTPLPQNYFFNLKAGWNTLGWPYRDSQEITAALCALNFGADYNQVSRLNNISKAEEHFLNQPAGDSFAAFDAGRGYYLYMLQDKAIRIGTTAPVISVSIAEDNLALGSLAAGATAVSATAINVTNDGSVSETYSLSLVNPIGWTAALTPGVESYVLNAAFSDNLTGIAWDPVNHALSTSAVPASAVKFAGDQTGMAVPYNEVRKLWFQFQAPTATTVDTEQDITVTITAQAS